MEVIRDAKISMSIVSVCNVSEDGEDTMCFCLAGDG